MPIRNGALTLMTMMILHLSQPHQADQMFDPDRILCMQALTNLLIGDPNPPD